MRNKNTLRRTGGVRVSTSTIPVFARARLALIARWALLAVLAGVSANASAMYKCKQEDGKFAFQDAPCVAAHDASQDPANGSNTPRAAAIPGRIDPNDPAVKALNQAQAERHTFSRLTPELYDAGQPGTPEADPALTAAADARAAVNAAHAKVNDEFARSRAEGQAKLWTFWINNAKWIALALLIGIFARWHERSFWAWFGVGILAKPILFALGAVDL